MTLFTSDWPCLCLIWGCCMVIWGEKKDPKYFFVYPIHCLLQKSIFYLCFATTTPLIKPFCCANPIFTWDPGLNLASTILTGSILTAISHQTHPLCKTNPKFRLQFILLLAFWSTWWYYFLFLWKKIDENSSNPGHVKQRPSITFTNLFYLTFQPLIIFIRKKIKILCYISWFLTVKLIFLARFIKVSYFFTL